MAGANSYMLQTILTVTVLLLSAMIVGNICKRLGIASVVGELLAGVLLAPTLFGGIFIFNQQLVDLNDNIHMLAQAGIILLIFLAGVETSFKKFIDSGLLATAVAIGGVVCSFVTAFTICALWGTGLDESLMICVATTATSVSVTYRTLSDMNATSSPEGIIMISSSVIDDVLGLITLAVVLNFVSSSSTGLAGAGITTLKAIGMWVLLMLVGIFIIARLFDLTTKTLKTSAHKEVLAFSTCFAFAWLAGLAGLSPIVGAFIAGMAASGTRLRESALRMASIMSTVLAVLFFTSTGAQADLTGITLASVAFAATLSVAAVAGKVLGCGLPVLAIRRSLREATLVGIGMVPRVEVGLIIAGIGLSMGILGASSYSAIILMAISTTVVAPILLKAAYGFFSKGKVTPGEPGHL
jgi:Kef-type K+ transport system membrane component KefB